MNIEKIDLYDYFSVPRKEASGGVLTSYLRTPSAEIKPKKRPAMLVLPGGGYAFLSDREGEPVALKYLGEGYCSFVLKYSTHAVYPVPLIEACMAVAYIRENAEKLGVSKNQIAAVGFSAGGHLCGMLATMYAESEVISPLGERAKLARPDAVVLSYPVVTMGEYAHAGSRDTISGDGKVPHDKLSIEKRVTPQSVPAFIWHTMEDNCVPVENSLMLATAYKSAGVPFTLHIFEKGWHGLSTVDREVFDWTGDEVALASVGKWFNLSIDWLSSRGFGVKCR